MRDAYESDKRITDPCEAVGKTVAQFRECDDDEIVFHFTDGTFLYLRARPGYDATAEMEYESEISMLPALQLGLIDRDQFNTWSSAKDAAAHEARERREREEFNRMRKKFGV